MCEDPITWLLLASACGFIIGMLGAMFYLAFGVGARVHSADIMRSLDDENR